jgi:hypothetical protein
MPQRECYALSDATLRVLLGANAPSCCCPKVQGSFPGSVELHDPIQQEAWVSSSIVPPLSHWLWTCLR